MITVYHLNRDALDIEDYRDILCMFNIEEVEAKIRAAWDAGAYVPVATLEGDDRVTAWRLTNNVDESWIENEQIVDLHIVEGEDLTHGRRSSQVGDIMQRNDEYFVIARIGYAQITLDAKGAI